MTVDTIITLLIKLALVIGMPLYALSLYRAHKAQQAKTLRTPSKLARPNSEPE